MRRVGLPVGQAPTPQALARDEGEAALLLLRDGHQREARIDVAHARREKRLGVAAQLVVAKGRRQRREKRYAPRDVVVEREEGEILVCQRSSIILTLDAGIDLQSGVEAVETGQIGLSAKHKHGRRTAIEQAGDVDTCNLRWQLMQYQQVVVAGVLVEIRRQERLHFVVLVVGDGSLEGGDVGMRSCGDDGNLLVSVDDLDGDDAAIVPRRLFAVNRRNLNDIVAHSRPVGLENNRFGRRETLVAETKRLRIELATIDRYGERRRTALEPIGIYGDFERKVVAKISNAIEADIGDGRVGMNRRVAHCNGIDRERCRRGGADRVCAAVVDAVGGQHEGTDVAMVEAVGHLLDEVCDIGRLRRINGLAVVGLHVGSERKPLHIKVLAQRIGKPVHLFGIGLVIESRIRAEIERLAFVLRNDDYGFFFACRFALDEGRQQQESYRSHSQSAQDGEEDAKPAREIALVRAPKPEPIERTGVGRPKQQTENEEVPRIIYNDRHDICALIVLERITIKP